MYKTVRYNRLPRKSISYAHKCITADYPAMHKRVHYSRLPRK